MFRNACFILAVTAAVASAYADVSACGDKFLRVGRSARFRRYASVHPSSILLYGPRWTGTGIKDFETMLKRAGHTPVTVTNVSALSEALATARYDVVITDFTYAGTMREAVRATGSPAALLPVVYKATKNEEAEAKAAYQCLLRPEKMTKFEALEEIDRLVDLRLKGTATPSRTR
jgi:hypothetical protein